MMTNVGVPCYREAVDERRSLVVELTREGKSAAEISAAMGITPRTVFRYRRHCGLSQPVPRRMDASDLERAAELLDDGCSYAEVARTLGFSLDGIRARFPGRGWTQEETIAWACLHQRRHFDSPRK